MQRVGSLRNILTEDEIDELLPIVTNHPDIQGKIYYIRYAQVIFVDKDDNIYYSEAELPEHSEFMRVFLLE